MFEHFLIWYQRIELPFSHFSHKTLLHTSIGCIVCYSRIVLGENMHRFAQHPTHDEGSHGGGPCIFPIPQQKVHPIFQKSFGLLT